MGWFGDLWRRRCVYAIHCEILVLPSYDLIFHSKSFFVHLVRVNVVREKQVRLTQYLPYTLWVGVDVFWSSCVNVDRLHYVYTVHINKRIVKPCLLWHWKCRVYFPKEQRKLVSDRVRLRIVIVDHLS